MHFPDNIREQSDHFVYGVEFGSTTLLGVNTTKFPVRHGNCFSMKTEDGVYYRIVNFYYENLKEGIRREKLTLPVRMYILGDPEKSRIAIIYDPRIPPSWYSDHFCETCTPVQFLPFPQRLSRELNLESGKVTESKTEKGMTISVTRIGDGVDWRTEEEKKPIVFANYRPQIQEPIIYMGSEIEAEMMKALREEIAEETKEADAKLFKNIVDLANTQIERTSDFRGFKSDEE